MIYYLDKAERPTIPEPHDCVIRSISCEDDVFTLEFERGRDLSERDSIQRIHPNATSLTVKLHLIDDVAIYAQKTRKFPRFKRWYEEIDLARLAGLVKGQNVAYLDHAVGYRSIVIELCCDTMVVLHLTADSVEYIWDT